MFLEYTGIKSEINKHIRYPQLLPNTRKLKANQDQTRRNEIINIIAKNPVE
jgi:hypothetical protein